MKEMVKTERYYGNKEQMEKNTKKQKCKKNVIFRIKKSM